MVYVVQPKTPKLRCFLPRNKPPLQLNALRDCKHLEAANDETLDGPSFTRVEWKLTWDDARRYCRIHYTDLAILQNLISLDITSSIYSELKSDPAWIGLFFDTQTGTLSWSSGTIFKAPIWLTSLPWPLPKFSAGFCALLKLSLIVSPYFEAAFCSDKNAFICYYDPAIGHLITTEVPLKVPTPSFKSEVQIGIQNFVRITGKEKTWSAALQYCQKHYTDLANLQNLTEGSSLKPIISDIQAWIGLYFDENTKSLRWSSNFDYNIPSWLLNAMFQENQCATIKRFGKFSLLISPALCTELKPFICFYDPSFNPMDHAAVNRGSSSTFLQNNDAWAGNSIISGHTTRTGQELSTVTQHWTPAANPEPTMSSSKRKAVTSQASSSGSGSMTLTSRPTRPGPTWIQPEPEPGNNTTSNCTTTTGQERSMVTGHQTPTASPESPGSISEVKAVTAQTSSSESGSIVPLLTLTSRPATRPGPTRSQPAPEPGSSSVTGGTSQGPLISPDPSGSPLSPGLGNTTTSHCTTTRSQERSMVTGHQTPPANPEPQGSPSEVKAVTAQTSSSESGSIVPLLTLTSGPATRPGPTRSQPAPEPGNTTTSHCTTTRSQERSMVPGHQTPPANPEPQGSPSEVKAVTAQTSSSESGSIVPLLTLTSGPATRPGPTRSQPAPEPGSSSVTGGTSQGPLISPDPSGSLLSPGSGNTSTSHCTTTRSQELPMVTGHQTPPASPEPTGRSSRHKAVTAQTSSSGTGSIVPHLTLPSRPTKSQPEPEPGSSSDTGKQGGGTSQGLLASPDPSGSPLSPESEQRFGILKADFNSPDILESKARKEQLLREIHETVKTILGHEQFRLKWIGFEENQN
ncbi:putative C-type lectin domain family 20 member A [Macrotis lagotis]|uniref:putative C-type lectin domain family 20 member A n=1 Tax=Macrotis lagotis TaxID=92651 RepID=UPI003D68F521